jgi:hypothetical protein
MRIVGGINLYRNLHRSLRTTAGLPLSRARDVRAVTPVDAVDEREPHFINTVGRHRAQYESLSRRAWWTERLGTESASTRRFTALHAPLGAASTWLRWRQLGQQEIASDSAGRFMEKMLELACHCQVQMSDELLAKYTQAPLQEGSVLESDMARTGTKSNNDEVLPVELNLVDLKALPQKFKHHDLTQDDVLMTFLSTWQPMNELLSSQNPARFKKLETTIATQVKAEKKRIQKKQAELFAQSPPDFVEQSNQLIHQYHSAPETIATRLKAHWIAELMASNG